MSAKRYWLSTEGMREAGAGAGDIQGSWVRAEDYDTQTAYAELIATRARDAIAAISDHLSWRATEERPSVEGLEEARYALIEALEFPNVALAANARNPAQSTTERSASAQSDREAGSTSAPGVATRVMHGGPADFQRTPHGSEGSASPLHPSEASLAGTYRAALESIVYQMSDDGFNSEGAPVLRATVKGIAERALAKNPNPSGHPTTEASLRPTGEASGPVGLGPVQCVYRDGCKVGMSCGASGRCLAPEVEEKLQGKTADAPLTVRFVSGQPAAAGKYVVEIDAGGGMRYLSTRSYNPESGWLGLTGWERVFCWLEGLDGASNCHQMNCLPDASEKLQWIVDLVTWDDHGAIAPKDSALSWESVARLALDYARAALIDVRTVNEIGRLP